MEHGRLTADDIAVTEDEAVHIRRPPGLTMDFVDKMLGALHSAGHRSIKPTELGTIGHALGVEPIMFDMVIQWAIASGRLTNGIGYVCRPMPGKKRTDGKGWTTNQGLRLLCTYFPDADDIPREQEDWSGWTAGRAGYAKAATEVAPETGKVHFHIYLEFPDSEVGKWICNIWPTVHIDQVRNPLKAVAYVLKGGDEWPIAATGLCTGPLEKTPCPHGGTRGSTADEKWAQILQAIENDDLDTIKFKYPREWICHQQTLMKMHAQARIKSMLAENAARRTSTNLKEKNLFLWGDAGTGKTYLARDRSGRQPYYKLQCKWWDGWDPQYTGIIWNDVVPFAGFNWQTLLDSADEYPFLAETKGGMTAINPVPVPVTVTSNHSIDELFEHATEARKDAFRRRFTVVEVRWARFGKARALNWKVEAGSKWKPPTDIWWDMASDAPLGISAEEESQIRTEIQEVMELMGESD
jgi:hypothetical protein